MYCQLLLLTLIYVYFVFVNTGYEVSPVLCTKLS